MPRRTPQITHLNPGETNPQNTTAVCLPGFGGSACAACPAGTFSAGGTASNPAPACAACPSNSTTTAPGATSSAQCTGGRQGAPSHLDLMFAFALWLK